MDNVLYHHGIRGQRWGKRNGPPYPLKPSAHSEREKRLNSRFAGGSTSTITKKKSFDYKKAAKIGLTLAVAGLAVYGVYKINQLYGSSEVGKGKDLLNDAMKKFGSSGGTSAVTSVENGFKKLSKPETVEEAMGKVNDYYRAKVSQNNCTSCSMAGFLRTKFGYDVKAQYMDNPRDGYAMLEDCMKNFSSNVFEAGSSKFGKSYDDASSMLLRRFKENGAEGVVAVTWAKNHSGHMFNWKIIDGKVQFMDYQLRNLTKDQFSVYFQNIDKSKNFFAVRLDNGDFDFDKVAKYIQKN